MKNKYFRIIMVGSMITLCQVASFLPINAKGLFADVNITGITKVVGQIGGVAEVQAKDDWDDGVFTQEDYDWAQSICPEGVTVNRPEDLPPKGSTTPTTNPATNPAANPTANPTTNPTTKPTTNPNVAINTTLKNTTDHILIVIDGNIIESDTYPEVVDGRVLVPIRVIAENLSCKVDYSDKAFTITSGNKETVIKGKVEQSSVAVNGVAKQIDKSKNVVVTVKKGRTYAPIRFFADTLGCSVNYKDRIVYVDLQ